MVDSAGLHVNKTPAGLDDEITPDDWSRARRAMTFFIKNGQYSHMDLGEVLYTALLEAYKARKRCKDPATLDKFATDKARFGVIDHLRKISQCKPGQIKKIRESFGLDVSIIHQNCSDEWIEQFLVDDGHVVPAETVTDVADVGVILRMAEKVLSPRQFERVVLHFMHDLTYTQIAKIHQVSLAAVQMGVETSIGRIRSALAIE